MSFFLTGITFLSTMQNLLKAATAEADKVMLTDAPLLFPPGQVIVSFVSLDFVLTD